MKKLYILACAAITSIATIAQTTSSEPTFIITELQAPQGEQGIVFSDSKYNATIEVSLKNATQKTWDGTLNISCLEEVFYEYPYVQLVSDLNSADPSNPSFVEIHSTGDAHIEKVEFILGTTGQESKLVCSSSFDGTDYFSAMYEDTEMINGGYGVYKNITAAGVDNICNESYSYIVPTHVTDWGANDYPDFRERAKYVRLNWVTGMSLGGNVPNRGIPTDLFAIKVYTNADTTVVGIEDQKEDQNSIQLNGDYLELTMSANVSIFDMNGKNLIAKNNTQQVDISSLNKGVYIVKAITDNKKALIKKIVR